VERTAKDVPHSKRRAANGLQYYKQLSEKLKPERIGTAKSGNSRRRINEQWQNRRAAENTQYVKQLSKYLTTPEQFSNKS
jgi:hypothetical protein